jgi:hypothetical protein
LLETGSQIAETIAVEVRHTKLVTCALDARAAPEGVLAIAKQNYPGLVALQSHQIWDSAAVEVSRAGN